MIKILIALNLSVTSTVSYASGYKALTIHVPDSITLAAQKWGNPNGPELVFIHGLGQSHLS